MQDIQKQNLPQQTPQQPAQVQQQPPTQTQPQPPQSGPQPEQSQAQQPCQPRQKLQISYSKTAWEDIKTSPKWKSKMLLLGLINLIPIFGTIVVSGYTYGWARDIAWKVKTPLPAHIFGNEDGALYKRGFFALVIGVLFALLPILIWAIGFGTLSTPSHYGFSQIPMNVRMSSTGFLSSMVTLAGIVAAGAAILFGEVGIMRMSIYGRLSAGFQLKKIWAMVRYDFSGLMKIVGMCLLLCLGLYLLSCALYAFAIGGSIFLGIAAAAAYDGGYAFFLVVALLMILAVCLWIVFAIVSLTCSVFVSTMVARAMGYWTSQFEVGSWLGQDDPMPFEVQEIPTQAPASVATSAATSVATSAATSQSAATPVPTPASAPAPQQAPAPAPAPQQAPAPAPASVPTQSSKKDTTHE